MIILKNIFYFLIFYCGSFLNYITKFLNINRKNKILLILHNGIGDIVLFSPALFYIKQKYIKFNIDILMRAEYKSLLTSCPYIDDVIDFNYKKYKNNIFYKISFLIQIFLRQYKITLYPVYSRERIGDEIVIWSSADEKIGWNTLYPSMKSFEKKRGDKIYTQLFESQLNQYEHELERYKELLFQLNIEKIRDFSPIIYYTKKEKKAVENILKQFNIKEKEIITVIPGALNKLRQWSSFKWKNLFKEIISITVNPIIFIVGSEQDTELIQLNSSDNLLKYVINLCGQLTLNELVVLFNKSSLIIGNETGPMHIAIASMTPTITILGGGHFGRFMPYGIRQKNRFIYNKLNCYQCEWNCIYSKFKCIENITVNDVSLEIQKFFLK